MIGFINHILQYKPFCFRKRTVNRAKIGPFIGFFNIGSNAEFIFKEIPRHSSASPKTPIEPVMVLGLATMVSAAAAI